MKDAVTIYEELLALTQLYLLQEHDLKEWIASEPESYCFFKARAQMQTRTSAAPKSEPVVPPQVAKASPQKVEQIPVPKIEKAAPPKPEAPMQKPETPAAPKQELPIASTAPKLQLEPLGKGKEQDLSEMHKLMGEKLPQVKSVKEVPPPSAAPSVLIVAVEETGEELLFLHNVAGAIDRLLLPAKVITLEKDKLQFQWNALLKQPNLRWLIAFGHLPGMKSSESPTVLIEAPAASLLRDPALKAALWKKLKALLK